MRTQPQHVLVVDDEPNIADTLALILRAHGYITRAAYDPEDAILLAPTFCPDVLVSDLIMPRMSGIELANWFSASFPDCRILLVSGNRTAISQAVGSKRDVHAHPFLAKPADPAAILAFVANCAPLAGRQCA